MKSRLLIALFAAGCAHLSPPEQGGPGWSSLTTAHFVLRTDVGAESARELVTGLEGLQGAMLRAGWQAEDLRRPRLQFVMFRNTRELHQFAQVEGMRNMTLEGFIAADLAGRSMLVSSADRPLDSDRTVAAMLAFNAARPFSRRLPWWVSDGMASLLARATVDGKSLVMGDVGETHFVLTKAARLRDPNHFHLSAEQPTSLLLIHWLRMQSPERLVRFGQLLASGQSEPAALAAAYPGLDDAQIDQELEKIRRDPPVRVERVPFPPYSGSVEVRALRPSEVHALWAEIYLGAGQVLPAKGVARRAEAELAEALRQDPSDVSANLASLRGRPEPEQIERLRQLAAAHPDDPRPLRLMLPFRSLPLPEQLDAADRLLALEPMDGPVKAFRAGVLSELGRWPEALAAATEAVTLVEPRADLYAVLIEAQVNLHRCSEAAETLVAAQSQLQNPAPLAHLADRCSP